MALSTRTKLAALGVGLAAGVLGLAGYAYAGEDTPGISYVTTVDDESTGPDRPALGSRGERGRDCPDKGGTGRRGDGSQSSPTPAPSTPPSTPPATPPAAAGEGDL